MAAAMGSDLFSALPVAQPALLLALGQALSAAVCGAFVSFTLGLVGGGGSILAVPLMIYVVGLTNPHMAIGTAALAVATSAFLNLIPHARAGHVRWGPAFAFAASGVVGAAVGSSVGKWVDGPKLLTYFAVLMLVVAGLMLRSSRKVPAANLSVATPYGKLCGTAIGAGSVSGFFGIGGGFLIVPGLMFSAHLAIVEAIGTSLVAVGSFGLTTACNYALSGQVDWAVAAEFVAGGALGGMAGSKLACRLAPKRGLLNNIFATMIVVVACYVLYRARHG